MADIAPAIVLVGAFFFVAHLLSGVFERTRVPDVLFLMVIGICLGPIFGLVSPEIFGAVGPVFVTITLILILFEGGSSMRMDVLRKSLGGALSLGLFSFLATMAVTAGLVLLFTDLEIIPAFILGAIVGSTSESIVIPMIKQLRLQNNTQTMLSVESSINDVLSIVITVALVQAYAVGEFSVPVVTGKLFMSFAIALASGVVGAFLWSILKRKVKIFKNILFITPAFVFIIYGLVEMAGASGAMAALAFGITLGNVEKIEIPFAKRINSYERMPISDTEKMFYSEIVFILKTYFFIYIGISLKLLDTWAILFAMALVAVFLVLRIGVVKLSMRRELPGRDASFVAILIPRGIAAAALASLPLQQGIPGGELIQNVTYGVVLFSIVFTSILVACADKTKLVQYYSFLLKPLKRRPKPLPEVSLNTIPDEEKPYDPDDRII
jgi:potassium/hydrogen antiporter